MANEANVGTQEQVVNVEATQPVQQQNAVPQAAPQQTVAAAPTNPPQQVQEPGWFKRNWKKVTAVGAAVLTAVGSAVVAYKKGQAAGAANAVPVDYNPLDPNQE